MTNPLRTFVRAGLILAVLAATTQARTIRLLTVGNSFAYNSTSELPALAVAGGHEIHIFHANISGGSLEMQVAHIKAHEADPDDPAGRPYKNRYDPRTGARRDFSLAEALQADAWDVVTIQQVSGLSFKPESYEPYAATVIDLVKKHAPQAEIVIHQTWAYREDHPYMTGNPAFTPAVMQAGLEDAYRQLAARYGLRIFPVGQAFWAARQTPRWTYTFPDPDYDYDRPVKGTVPRQPGSLFNGWHWEGERLVLDAFHANQAGRYLGGCVFYEMLFGDDVTRLDYHPAGLSAGDAAQLRRIARETVAGSGSQPTP